MPAIVAMTTTPIAQRDTDSVTRSHTPSQRSSSPGMSTLASERFRFVMSVSRKRQMKRIVNAARKTEKKLPAMPSTAEIASGTDTETCSAPDWTFPAAPESPSHESSSESRSCSTSAGRSWRKSRTDPTSGTRSRRKKIVTRSAVPSTVMVAARPRDMFVFLMTKRTGYSKTSARKMPTKTIRKVSPIALKASATPAAAPTMSSVRTGTRSSTRRVPAEAIARRV